MPGTSNYLMLHVIFLCIALTSSRSIDETNIVHFDLANTGATKEAAKEAGVHESSKDSSSFAGEFIAGNDTPREFDDFENVDEKNPKSERYVTVEVPDHPVLDNTLFTKYAAKSKAEKENGADRDTDGDDFPLNFFIIKPQSEVKIYMRK